MGDVACVGGPWGAREFAAGSDEAVRRRSCVRPLMRHMAAGPDGFREQAPNTDAASRFPCNKRGSLFVGSTDHHLLQPSLHPGTGERVRRSRQSRRPTWRPACCRDTLPRSPSWPIRRGPSCWPEPPPRACPACAPAMPATRPTATLPDGQRHPNGEHLSGAGHAAALVSSTCLAPRSRARLASPSSLSRTSAPAGPMSTRSTSRWVIRAGSAGKVPSHSASRRFSASPKSSSVRPGALPAPRSVYGGAGQALGYAPPLEFENAHRAAGFLHRM